MKIIRDLPQKGRALANQMNPGQAFRMVDFSELYLCVHYHTPRAGCILAVNLRDGCVVEVIGNQEVVVLGHAAVVECSRSLQS